MKRRWIVLAFAGLLALSMLVPAVAQQRSGWLQKRRASFLVQHIANDLALSDGQRSQIKAILQNEQPRVQALLKATKQTNEQLRSRNSFDEAFVRSVAQQQAATTTEAIVERERIRGRIMAVLSPDQQQKFNQITSEFRSALEERIATLGDQL